VKRFVPDKDDLKKQKHHFKEHTVLSKHFEHFVADWRRFNRQRLSLSLWWNECLFHIQMCYSIFDYRIISLFNVQTL